jgi:hypothetical protein
VLKPKLAEGMGYDYYEELAWPHDLLYVFSGNISRYYCNNVCLAVLELIRNTEVHG